MKKQFNLQDWLKDKSQNIETRDGRPARIICTDAKADDGACIIALIPGYGGEEAYQFFPDGRAFSSKSSDEDCADLFLVTPEPELSEFEKKLSDVFGYAISMSVSEPKKPTDEFVREYAPELLAIARKQLQPEIDEAYKTADEVMYRKGKEDGIVEARNDISARIIALKQEKDRAAEALKDLPKWEKCPWYFEHGDIGKTNKDEDILSYQGYSILLSDLAKLPKEDSHE